MDSLTKKVREGLECHKDETPGVCGKCPYFTESGFCSGRLAKDALKVLDELLKEQEAVDPQDAEMLIIHNGGAEEYVKDIESIVLLAHKDYDIVYCGTFGRSVKWK